MALKGNNPGKLDQRITLLQPTVEYDSTTNAPVRSYAAVAQIRAMRFFKNSTERIEANQQVGVTTQDFMVRDYMSIYPIDNNWRIEHDGLTYDVRGVEKIGRRNYIIISAEHRGTV